jgi:hypothetical protein
MLVPGDAQLVCFVSTWLSFRRGVHASPGLDLVLKSWKGGGEVDDMKPISLTNKIIKENFHGFASGPSEHASDVVWIREGAK